MIAAVIRWSLQNRLIVILANLALVGVGLYSAVNLNVEAYPDPTPPLIAIITQSRGASPEVTERLIGIPLETALNGMPGLKYLRSTSISGLNDIRCQFLYGTDYQSARQEVLNRIAHVDLPNGAKPELSPLSPPAKLCAMCWKGRAIRPTSSRPCRTWSLIAL